MNVQKLVAILFIFCCSAGAWFILGTSVVVRTGSTDQRLQQEVARLWGGSHVQVAPQAWVSKAVQSTETVQETGSDGEVVQKRVTKPVVVRERVPLSSSRIDVTLALEHRRKGLLWYDLYDVEFSARYTVVAPDPLEGPLHTSFDFPTPDSIYDDFSFRVGGREGSPSDLESSVSVALQDAVPGEEIPIEVSYRSRGLDTWIYSFRGNEVSQVRDFELTLSTDFLEIDFPAGTLSPSEEVETDTGMGLVWRFDNLVTGRRIGVDLPNRLNPGPLTSRVTYFAPVSLLFFITVMVILGIVQGRSLHPMHYFFLSAAFFAFHLLLAYLVDHLDVHVSFAISAVVSVFLVVSYLRVVGGTRFALAQAGLAQLIYLVLFNYAFFFKGFTGLAISVGAVITLFVLMQITAAVDWDKAFGTQNAAVGPEKIG